MAKLNMVQAINCALLDEMGNDDMIVIMGEDVGVNGGVFRVTEGLYEKFGADRVIDTPLAESGIIGTAIGMAAYGMKPVAEIQFMGFLPPALDQIISHASRLRNRRIKVIVPSSPHDAKGLMISALRDPDPVVFLEPKKIYRAFKEEVPEDSYSIPIGKARVWRGGEDLTIISWGAMVRLALEAAEIAAESGYDCGVIDLRTLSPFDEETIVDAVGKTGRAVILHEAPRTCSLGAEIVSVIQERVFYYLEAPIERVAGFDIPMPLLKMEGLYMPHLDRVLAAINKVMKS
jgi:pyruvate dehydrogenase E1 component beta subunit